MFEHASDMEVASKDEPARGGREAYCGMTLVERLGVAGLLGEFNTAVQQRNREVMISLLPAATGGAHGCGSGLVRRHDSGQAREVRLLTGLLSLSRCPVLRGAQAFVALLVAGRCPSSRRSERRLVLFP